MWTICKFYENINKNYICTYNSENTICIFWNAYWIMMDSRILQSDHLVNVDKHMETAKILLNLLMDENEWIRGMLKILTFKRITNNRIWGIILIVYILGQHMRAGRVWNNGIALKWGFDLIRKTEYILQIFTLFLRKQF